MITVLNKDDGTLCYIDEFELDWAGEHISDLYYDQGPDVEAIAFRLLDLINNSTCYYWGIEDVCQ